MTASDADRHEHGNLQNCADAFGKTSEGSPYLQPHKAPAAGEKKALLSDREQKILQHTTKP